MRVVVYEFMSLDGVVQAPGGPEEDTDGGFAHGGWSHPVLRPRGDGRRSSTTAWTPPRRCSSAGARGREWRRRGPNAAGDPYADQMNAIEKYVASRTLTEHDLTWNSTLLPRRRG